MNRITDRSWPRFLFSLLAVIVMISMLLTGGLLNAQADPLAPISIPIGTDGFDETAFDVKPDIDMISGWEWLPNTQVTISLPDHGYSTSTNSTADGDVDFPPLPIDIVVGNTVTMSDGTTTKSTIVVPLEFVSYSLQEDTVSGTAAPYAVVWGFTCPMYAECGDSTTAADGQGKWVLGFSVTGIDPGSDGGVYIWDGDGDATSFFWSFPFFEVSLNHEISHGIQWSRYSEVSVFVDGVKFATVLSDGDGHVEIHDLNVKADQKVKLTDGKYTKIHKVRNLKMISVDPLTDKVKGTADPGSEVSVSAFLAWGEPPAVSIPVTTKTDGTWVANFGSAGWDITHDSFGNALICDNDGDCTRVIWEGPPDDIVPSYGGKLTTSKVSFNWPDEPGADQYKLQLSTREDFSTLVLGVKTTDSAYAYDVKLPNSTTYYWRVRPLFAEEKGDWSLAWKFVSMDPLVKPLLIFPKPGESVFTSTPTFIWGEVTNAASYLIQISKSSLFDTLVQKATVTNASYLATPLAKGTYYWRVRTIDASGGKGPWSDVLKFKVVLP